MQPAKQTLSDGAYLDEFKIIKTLGSGYHAKVKLAVKDGKEYAIKRFKQDTADLSVLEHQLGVMSKLKHNNIVNLIEVRKNATYKKQNGFSYSCFAIILEYINGGELFQYVARCGRFSPNVARTYFTMLLDALKYLHEQGVTHRDIKPENILLDKDFNLKVTDFGFSTFLSRGELNTRLGTQGYMAPEIRERKYQGADVDLFAAGIILFILYSGSPPFEKATNTDPYYKVFSAKKFDIFWKAHSKRKPEGFYSKQFIHLINNMLIPIPSERLSMSQVINHPWTTGDSVTLTQINEQFKIKKQKIDEARQKQRQEKAEKREKIKQIENSTNRSGSEFASFFNRLDQIKLDASLLKQAQNEANDLILNQKPEFFIAFVQEFFNDKKANLIADQQQTQNITVTFNSIESEIIIHVKYTILEQDQNIEIKGQLTKTNDNKLRVRFFRDENGSAIRSLNLIEILKRQFDYLL